MKNYYRDDKLPLKGISFAAAGNLYKRQHHELKDFIIRNGGSWSDTLSGDLDYVVSTYPETLTSKNKIKKAKEIGLAIVTELLVDRLVESFGFEQSPYLLSGVLPPVAFAKLATSDEDKSKKTEVINIPDKNKKNEPKKIEEYFKKTRR